MPKHKPVTDHELVMLIVRLDDIRGIADDLVRRMSGKHAETFPELPIDRASQILAGTGALIDLATLMLRPAWIEESQAASKTMLGVVGGKPELVSGGGGS